jgi:hypothetical protein
MFETTVRLNGKIYMGLGDTRKEATKNCFDLVQEKFGYGIAMVSRRLQKVENGKK